MTAKQRASSLEREAPPRDDPSVMAPGEVLQHLLKLYNRLLAPFSLHLEKRFKISINEFRALMLVGEMGATASHELAELTGVNAMAVSRSVAALARHGRVDVGVDPDNRRRKIIRLTAEGRRLFELMQPTSDKVALFLFDALRVDEIMAFDRYLTTIITRLEAHDEAGTPIFLEQTKPDDPAA